MPCLLLPAVPSHPSGPAYAGTPDNAPITVSLYKLSPLSGLTTISRTIVRPTEFILPTSSGHLALSSRSLGIGRRWMVHRSMDHLLNSWNQWKFVRVTMQQNKYPPSFHYIMQICIQLCTYTQWIKWLICLIKTKLHEFKISFFLGCLS